jgi:hypothetical protein
MPRWRAWSRDWRARSPRSRTREGLSHRRGARRRRLPQRREGPSPSVLGRRRPAELVLPASTGSNSPRPSPSALGPSRRVAMGAPGAAAGLRAGASTLRARSDLPSHEQPISPRVRASNAYATYCSTASRPRLLAPRWRRDRGAATALAHAQRRSTSALCRAEEGA